MRKNTHFLILSILILLVISGFLIYQYKTNHISANWLEYKDNDLKIQLFYPEKFQKSEITEELKQAGVILRVTQEDPSALFALRYEKNLETISINTEEKIIDVLIRNTSIRHFKVFPDYRKESETQIKIDGMEAKEVLFTYLGNDTQTSMKQRLIIVTRNYGSKDLGTVAFYLSFQSKESDFSTFDPTFDLLLQSLKFL